jgi:hypothetical protein
MPTPGSFTILVKVSPYYFAQYTNRYCKTCYVDFGGVASRRSRLFAGEPFVANYCRAITCAAAGGCFTDWVKSAAGDGVVRSRSGHNLQADPSSFFRKKAGRNRANVRTLLVGCNSALGLLLSLVAASGMPRAAGFIDTHKVELL